MEYSLNLSGVLRYLLSSHDLRPADLAKVTGVPQPTVHRMVKGICPRPHKSSMLPIANYFAISIDQLTGNEPLYGLSLYTLKQRDGWTKIPLLDWQQLSSWPNLDIRHDTQYTKTAKQINPQQTTFTEVSVTHRAFAVDLNDNSNSIPLLFSVGTRLLFEPRLKAKNHDFILLRHSKHTVLFCQFLLKGNNRYYQVSNTQTNTTTIHPIEQDNEILGILIESRTLYRR